MARPDSPENVTATEGLPTITITWDAVVGASSYTIYRSATQEQDASYTIGITDETTWIDTTAMTNSVYWYSVSAYSGGCSLPSAPMVRGFSSAAEVTIPDRPVNLMAVVVGP